MARFTTVLVVLVSCAVFATVAYADCSGTSTYKFQFFEHITKPKHAFGPAKQQNGETGNGYTYDNPCTKTWDPKSELYGFAGGLYVYTSARLSQDIFTIYFNDIGAKGGTFAKAQIHMRGLWKEDADGNDLPNQEIAVVGGVGGGLGAAYGTVKYTQVGDSVFLVQGELYVDSAASNGSSSLEGKILQVTPA